jgi:hypothetical protein
VKYVIAKAVDGHFHYFHYDDQATNGYGWTTNEYQAEFFNAPQEAWVAITRMSDEYDRNNTVILNAKIVITAASIT